MNRYIKIFCLFLCFISSFSPHSLFIVSGETSGDRLGAWYAQRTSNTYSELQINGVGGTYLQEKGASLCMTLDDVEKHNLRLLNFRHPFELFSKLKKIYYLVSLLTREIISKNPDEVVLVDFPFVNIPLAWNLKRTNRDIHITYLAPPALWVHGSWGIHRILKSSCDRVIVLFPFEKTWYQEQCAMNVEYHGYPFLDDYHFSDNHPCKRKPCIALFPGSRKKELEITIPLFAKVIHYFKECHSEVSFIVSKVPTISKKYFIQQFEKAGVSSHELSFIDTHEEKELLSPCCLALTKPGTNTLELALQGIPHIMIYQVPWWMYYFFKYTFTIPYVGLPNLLAGKELCPELLQSQCTSENLISATETLYEIFKNDKKEYTELCNELVSLRNFL